MTDETREIHDGGATMSQEQADALVASMKDRKPRSVSRLTVVESIYHQCGCDQPTQHTSRYAAECLSDQAPYVRPRIRTIEKWENVDFGYIGQRAGVVVVENTGDKRLQLGIRVDGGIRTISFIPQKASVRLYYAETLYIKGENGQYTIKVFPE